MERALERGLEALAISDHDTFAGYDQAIRRPARRLRSDLRDRVETLVLATKALRCICSRISFASLRQKISRVAGGVAGRTPGPQCPADREVARQGC